MVNENLQEGTGCSKYIALFNSETPPRKFHRETQNLTNARSVSQMPMVKPIIEGMVFTNLSDCLASLTTYSTMCDS